MMFAAQQRQPGKALLVVALALAVLATPAAAEPTRTLPIERGATPAMSLARTTHRLQYVSPAEFETAIQRLWGRRAVAAESVGQQTATFQLTNSSGATTLTVNRGQCAVTIESPADQVAWKRLVEAIDCAPPTAQRQAAIVPVERAAPATLQRTIALLKAAAAMVSGGSNHRRQHIGQFVAVMFQPEAAAQPAPPQPGALQPPGGQPGGPEGNEIPAPGGEVDAVVGATGDVAALAGRIGDVKIEIVEGLDIIIITGKRADVDRVEKIIEEIERQSVENRPEVEIYYLKHVDGQALNTIIQQVYATTLGARLGQVSITPLVKPNALMLIGRKESIPAVVELIQKLDRPVPSNAQLKVFHLKHMSAIDAERTVRQFFVERPGQSNNPRIGLDVQVQVIAEYRANTLIVQASPRDMAEVTRLLESLDIEGPGAVNEVRVFKLRNSLAEQLAPVLQEAITGRIAGQQAVPQQQQQQVQGGQGGQTSPAIATPPAISLQFLEIGPEGQKLLESGILANMRITADASSNTLIVIGPGSSMELMGALIRQLDELPATVAELKVFTMVNGDATTLVQMLQELFSTQQQGGQGQQGLQQSATGAGESTLVPLRFSVDQRTNSIIVSGNPGDLEVVRNVLVRLDASDLVQRITTVYRLHNAPAADVATAINNLLDRQRDLNQAAPELITAYQQIEREVLIEPETVTNSLIVSATPKYFEDIKRIVTELDRRPPRVVIQVLLAEVTLADDEQFGIEWGLQDSLLFDRGIVGGPRFNWLNAAPGNDNTPASLATRGSAAGQAISDFALDRADDALGFGGLVLSASSESVNVLIRALEQSSRAQVISRPQVQTLDNQTAYVNVGALVPRITGGAISNIGTFNPEVEDISVGIILEVTPRTSPDGTIVMQINATKSQVGPEAEGIPIFADAGGNVIRSPQIPITTAQTIVSAKSGQTIILGGLITNDQQEVTRRVPYLGDIPVAGRLFRFDSVRNRRTELLLIMTPFVITDDEQNDWLNARESERMSWCLADIVNIHGPVGLSGNPGYNYQPSDVIYPDLDPTAPGPTPAAPPASQPEFLPGPGQPTWYPQKPPPQQLSQRPNAATPTRLIPTGIAPGAVAPGPPGAQALMPHAAVPQVAVPQPGARPPGPPPVMVAPGVQAASFEQPLR